jgi:small conductance mechanosensitive channel
MDTFHDLARQVTVFAPRLAVGVFVFLFFCLASVVTRRLILRVSKAADVNTRFIIRLAGRTAAIALLAFGTVSALGTMGINVSALVAGLGLTGFALGFALKDVLSNFLAGVLILLYRPFELNDHIIVAGSEGIVTEIDLRYTTLQKEGQKFLIPNSVLITNTISVLERNGGGKGTAG